MQNILVVSPHPDDETLAAGGLLLKYKEKGSKIFWLNITDIYEEYGWSADRVESRRKEIHAVCNAYGFSDFVNLGIPTTTLDSYPLNKLIEKIGEVFNKLKPNLVILPNFEDIHSEHARVFQAAFSCTKVFRYPFIKMILTGEILSESEFGITNSFRPNYFIDITKYLSKKIEIMKIYKSELGLHPFPRSEESLRAQALLRGAQAGCSFAEAFHLIKFNDTV